MKTDSFDADLRQALARGAAEVPGEAVERLRRRDYRPRTRRRAGMMASAGLAGTAAAAIALGVAMSQPASRQGSQPASHPVKAQLAAWTVTREADGTVSITLREMRDPAGLQRKLRADGVPASVNTTGNPACQQYSVSTTRGASLGQVFQIQHNGSGDATIIDIHASALPSGAGAEISGRVPGFVVMHLIRTSQQCTGS
jgi:hypothetical protein